MHGQWDWMRDPKIHSTTWEWDHASAAEGWKKSHNFEHHTYTNVLNKDRDLGYSIMRISPDQPWHPAHLAQPVYNQLLALFFEWGVAFYDLEVDLVQGRQEVQGGVQARLEALLAQGPPPAREGLRAVPGAVRPAGLPGERRRELRGQLGAQLLGARGDLLRALPRGRRGLPRGPAGRRDARAVVRAPDAGLGEPVGQPAPARHDRQPQPPDRAPHLPGHPEQQVPGDRAAGAGDLRALRAALHDRTAAEAVRHGAAQDQPVRPAPSRGDRRREGAATPSALATLPVRTAEVQQPVRLAG